MALRTIEASFLHVGGTPRLGLTPGQGMGLEPVPFRDAAMAAETRAKTVYWAKMVFSPGSSLRRLPGRGWLHPVPEHDCPMAEPASL